ncbi:unnamed protein product [Meganyctiphanes norvegica]|uniref:Extensin-like n=2 Tax=Meganyctiphanes norvegica TaxID=48144 RepID=A0AAV2SP81_MEGNR
MLPSCNEKPGDIHVGAPMSSAIVKIANLQDCTKAQHNRNQQRLPQLYIPTPATTPTLPPPPTQPASQPPIQPTPTNPLDSISSAPSSSSTTPPQSYPAPQRPKRPRGRPPKHLSSSQPHLTHSQPALSNPIPATLHSNSQPALSTSYQQPHLVISTHPPINHPATPSSLPTTSRSLSTTSSPHLPLFQPSIFQLPAIHIQPPCCTLTTTTPTAILPATTIKEAISIINARFTTETQA